MLKDLGIVAGIGYAFVTYLQWRDVRDNFRVDQRAWMGVANIQLVDAPLRVGGILQAVVTISNSGKTPATKMKTLASVQLLLAGTPLIPKYLTIGSPSISVVMPNTQMLIPTLPIEAANRSTVGKINESDLEDLKTGRYLFYVFGRINYDDVFTTHHFTHFCAFLNPRTLSTFQACDTYGEAE